MNNSDSRRTISLLGCGWLGLPVATALHSKGYKVKGSTTSLEKLELLKGQGIEPYLINLFEKADSLNLNEFLQSDVLIINYPPGLRKGGREQFEKSIDRLLNYIHLSHIKKVIYVSSTSVYPNSNGLVSEEMDLKPDSEAGKVLLDAENRIAELPGKEIVVLRMAGLIGYDRQPGRFFAGKNELKNGQEHVNLIHRDDCIGIILRLLGTPLTGVFNCCSDSHPLKKEFYTKAAQSLGLALPEFLPSEGLSFKIVSNRKVKDELGYNFVYGDLAQFNWP